MKGAQAVFLRKANFMELSQCLLNWYDHNGRELPWRGGRDPYPIWLSEIMLQQTRAETVMGYYRRFLERFQDVHALAAAPLDTVLKMWEGLGYYSRARNLHRAAQQISESGGRFPDTVKGLEALPGVGPYVARAIASIAYGICVPALDGNQMRVLSRCFAVERILKTPFDLEEIALSCISKSRPGDYNQALMDLGALICTPRKPKCEICPLAKLCRAHSIGEPERYPLRPAPVAKREEARTVFLIQLGEGMAIRRRDQEKLLGGLYEFPCVPGHLTEAEARRFLAEMGILNPHSLVPLPPARHVFTHMIWRMQGWHLQADALPDHLFAANADDLRARAFPSALRPYFEIALSVLEGK